MTTIGLASLLLAGVVYGPLFVLLRRIWRFCQHQPYGDEQQDHRLLSPSSVVLLLAAVLPSIAALLAMMSTGLL